MTITYALMERLEALAAAGEDVRIVTKARVTALLVDDAGGGVVGVRYDHDGQSCEAHGPGQDIGPTPWYGLCSFVDKLCFFMAQLVNT